MMLTTAEAAALLNERGYTKKTHKARPITADAVKRQCYKGIYPGAKHYAGSGRGVWLIPLADIEAELARQSQD
jgi:hypothetical protein